MSAFPPEVVQLFVDEAETRLARLADELLRLEDAGPVQADLVDSVFRDAHTLKGTAGMMGYSGFAQVAHHMEDLLHQVREGTLAPGPALVDGLLAGVDGMRRHLHDMVAGPVDESVWAEVQARVVAAGEHAAGEGPIEVPPPVAAAALVMPAAAVADVAVARVPVARMDAIDRLAGEAGVSHTRLVGDLAEALGPGATLPREAQRLGHVLAELRARTTEARMVPVATVLEPVRRAVRDIARSQGKVVRFEAEGEETELDRAVLDRLADAVGHLVRNAVDHGVEPPAERVAAGKSAQAVVRVTARQQGREVVVAVADDGRGIDPALVMEAAGESDMDQADVMERLFQPGFSTASEVTELSGRGVGLDAVRSTLASVRGGVEVRSEPGYGTTFVLRVPLTVAAVPCVIVRCAGRSYALALSVVAATRLPDPGDVALADVLGLRAEVRPSAAVVVEAGGRTRAFAVEELVAQRDVVVESVGALPSVPVVAGAAVQGDGTVLIVLDGAALLDHPIFSTAPAAVEKMEGRAGEGAGRRVLVVDDAAVVREVQVAALRRAGYEVQAAADGAEALAVLRRWPADLALVDIEMPVMDGLALTQALRADPALRGTAVLIFTSLGSEADRRRGMEAGADGYMVKATYTPDALLEAIARLLGEDR
ncbi:MAG: two-component system, chemotaxis family, sensor kinase CheA [Acidimicrobiaceae bacterium]|nr:two-component system, chemotaxis family, sensor kinase CheA [Acidimicrobiaceae bacterium]